METTAVLEEVQYSPRRVVAAGFALFSMFFGAGDLIWPLILGGQAGSQNFYAMSGFLITGVTLPLLGLCAMLMFFGNYNDFFSRLGRWPGFVVIFIVQAILGPIGSIPRLYTLAHATMKPYLPFEASLLTFSILSSVVVLCFTIKRSRVVDILGTILTPILLISLGMILFQGLSGPPAALVPEGGSGFYFKHGVLTGYNTLDLIASFIFAPFVLSYFCDVEGESSERSRGIAAKQMLQASCIAAVLLSLTFVGLTYVASYYTPVLGEHLPEERLSMISLHLLGREGALLSCVAVAMACLTTAIPLTTIAADYIRRDLLNDKVNQFVPLLFVLIISGAIANLGFMGIAESLSPVLHILCPGLIMLCLFNIYEKVYNKRLSPWPIFVVFGLTAYWTLV